MTTNSCDLEELYNVVWQKLISISGDTVWEYSVNYPYTFLDFENYRIGRTVTSEMYSLTYKGIYIELGSSEQDKLRSFWKTQFLLRNKRDKEEKCKELHDALYPKKVQFVPDSLPWWSRIFARLKRPKGE